MRYSLLLILWFLTGNTGRAEDLLIVNKPASVISPVEKTYVPSGSENFDVAIISKGFEINSKDSFAIQIGAFKTKVNAEILCKKVKERRKLDAKIIDDDGYYKVRVRRVSYNNRTGEQSFESDSGKIIIASADSFLKNGSIYKEVKPQHIDSVSKDSIRNYPVKDTASSVSILFKEFESI